MPEVNYSYKSHQGHVALVTGAAGGFGRAISFGLAKRGADVVIVDIADPAETKAAVEAEGVHCVSVTADLTSEQDIARAAEEASALGDVDILVNNVGIFPFVAFDDLDLARWRQIMSVNLESQFLMTKAVLPAMRRKGSGRIVNLTSNSLTLNVPEMTAYMASKMGVVGFTRGLANDLAPDNITVNAVGPTLSRTPGVAAAVPEEVIEQVKNLQAIKKVGEAEDVVGAILFLTCDDSYFVTGQVLWSDGGLARGI